jgi:hypothetical protein
MPFRTFAIASLLFAAPALAAPAVAPVFAPFAKRPPIAAPAKRPAPTTSFAPPVMFYIAHGPPDACGRGCDRWIAVEGQINADAAIRFKTFITRHLKDRQLPIYLSSPGGNLEQGLFIGNMLREMSAVARVGRTIVSDCGFEPQGSELCLRVKRSGRELAGNLSTRGAQCHSACPYMMLGATTREVAPDAILGVHSPKVVLRYSGSGLPSSEMIGAATQRAVLRGDRLLSDYVVRMGIEGELLDVARRIKFEDMHVLTRDQIFRFGIDRREFVETPWMFENLGRPLIRKSALARSDDGKAWRALQWRLFCLSPGQFQLEFHRPRSRPPPRPSFPSFRFRAARRSRSSSRSRRRRRRDPKCGACACRVPRSRPWQVLTSLIWPRRRMRWTDAGRRIWKSCPAKVLRHRSIISRRCVPRQSPRRPFVRMDRKTPPIKVIMPAFNARRCALHASA